MAVEQVYRGAAPVGVGRGLVASSFQYYLTGDESLRVTVQSLTAPRVVELAWRFWREADQAIVLTRQSIPLEPVGPLSVTKLFPLDAGALINLRVGVGALSVQYGLVWVRVQIVRGNAGAIEIIGTLLQGFISTQNDVGWPGSPIEKQDQTTGFQESEAPVLTAGTATWTVPVGERWIPYCGRFNYAAGGVVANRFPFITVSDNVSASVYFDASNLALGAGASGFYAFGAGVSHNEGTASALTTLSFPQGLELAGGSSIAATALGAQVGDAVVGAILLIRTRVDG